MAAPVCPAKLSLIYFDLAVNSGLQVLRANEGLKMCFGTVRAYFVSNRVVSNIL